MTEAGQTQVKSADAGTTVEDLAALALRAGRREAVAALSGHNEATIVAVLQKINPGVAQELLAAFAPERRQHILAAADPDVRSQWSLNQTYRPDSIGRMMDPPIGLFKPEATVTQAVEQLRQLVRRAFITYGFVVDDENRLIGVVVMRDMLLADPATTLKDLMIRNPFTLKPEMTLMDAMKAVLNKHFPVYPVCDDEGRLVGLVRGQNMFEKQAIEISAQAGSMVGVDKEERLATPWPSCLRSRHPWLQLNLLTSFIAAAVVGAFQSTIDRFVVLAIFLPVLMGQSANTGCQALAVALRALTLGEVKDGSNNALVIKELILGLTNGVLVGLTTAAGMYFAAVAQDSENPMRFAWITFIAMTGSCIVSGVCGAIVPLALKRMGTDPATASSIFLTTITDVFSMGFFLGLAALLL